MFCKNSGLIYNALTKKCIHKKSPEAKKYYEQVDKCAIKHFTDIENCVKINNYRKNRKLIKKIIISSITLILIVISLGGISKYLKDKVIDKLREDFKEKTGYNIKIIDSAIKILKNNEEDIIKTINGIGYIKDKLAFINRIAVKVGSIF